MDVFTNPLPNTYLTWTPFTIPSNTTGGTRGIAVSYSHFQYLNSIYTTLITGIFAFVWQFAIHVALVLYPTEKRSQQKDREKDGVSELKTGDQLETRKRKANRYISLIIIWNAPNPWAAMFQLGSHAFSMIFYANDRKTGIYDISAIGFAVLVGASSVLGSTIIPSFLRKGSVAPANPSAVFYVYPVASDSEMYIAYQQAKAPAAQRALGIVEFASQAVWDRVRIHPTVTMDWTGPNGESIDQTTYEYNVTGFDFGLQHKNAANFGVRTKGACTLEYNFYDANSSSNSFDSYLVYGQPARVARQNIYRPTGAVIMLDTNDRSTTQSNNTYTIVPDTVGRLSLKKGTDPWYNTSTTTPLMSHTYYVVDNQRPVLSCWQKDTWYYQEHIAEAIDALSNLPGLDDIPDIIRYFIQERLTNPIIFDIASALGTSILISSGGSIARIFDASRGNHTADFERLIVASYVATRNILRDTTMLVDYTGLNNSALDASGKPIPSAGDFVVTSGDVVSLSLVSLIVIPLVWVFLWVIRAIVSFGTNADSNSGALSRLTLRALCFQPVQMYRLIDELVCGYRDDWFGRTGEMPYIAKGKEVQIFDNRPGRAPSMVEQMDLENEETVVPRTSAASTSFALFAAPKVVLGPDGKYHIRFTGPMGRQRSMSRWSMGKSRPGSMIVVDQPADETAEEEVRKFLAIGTASEEQLPLLRLKKSAPSV